MKAYQCRFCGAWEQTQQEIMDHVQGSHPKELSAAKISYLKTHADPNNIEHLLNIANEIKYHTLKYLVDETDTKGEYSIDEALHSAEMHQFFFSVEACGYKNCQHQEPDTSLVNKALASLNSRKGE